MKKIILLVLFLVVSGCSNINEIKDSPLYEGPILTIGVVGEAPIVREENIIFSTIKLADLHQENFSSRFHSIFIMEEHLSEAAKAPYAKIYKDSDIPFFFIESKKSYVPFLEEEIGNEEFPDFDSGEYATGYYHRGEEIKHWGYGLYNDTVNEANILDLYSRIFETIDTIDNPI